MSEETKALTETETPKRTGAPVAPAAPAADFYTDIGMQAVQVGPKMWAFQQVTGDYLKQLERQARNPRTGQTDSRRLLRIWYDNVVLGEAVVDAQGNCTGVRPEMKIDFSQLSAPALNAFEAELTSFLGYLD